MFCAAIPMTASLSVALHGKIREQEKMRDRQDVQDVQAAGETRSTVPPSRAVVLLSKGLPYATVGLVILSLLYHGVVVPRTGA
jgi:hypothetical protein